MIKQQRERVRWFNIVLMLRLMLMCFITKYLQWEKANLIMEIIPLSHKTMMLSGVWSCKILEILFCLLVKDFGFISHTCVLKQNQFYLILPRLQQVSLKSNCIKVCKYSLRSFLTRKVIRIILPSPDKQKQIFSEVIIIKNLKICWPK